MFCYIMGQKLRFSALRLALRSALHLPHIIIKLRGPGSTFYTVQEEHPIKAQFWAQIGAQPSL